jgi:hypothetical protein
MIGSLRLRTRLLRSVAATLLVAFTGCFSYIPAAAPPSRQGERVRLHLSDPAEFRLSEITLNNVGALTGELVSSTGDELVLSVWALRSASGQEHSAAGETVRVDRSNVAGVERYRFSPLRSAILAGALIVGGVLFIGLVGGGDSGGESTGGGTPPTQ